MANDKKKLDIPGIFKSDADDILKARQDAIRIHKSDIRAAGNEIELSVRSYFKRILPSKYYVTSGHLIDANGEVSPQLDLIISDNSNVPALMTTKDGTEYIPVDSVYAIGEIKSTYYKSENYIQGFSKVLEDISGRLIREEIPNTAFNGQFNGETLLRDTMLAKGNRVLNKLFSFILFVDKGDFDFEEIAPYYLAHSRKLLPNVTAILNSGVIIHGNMKDSFAFNRYPDEVEDDDCDWYFSPFLGDDESGSLEGNHLGFLYYVLLEHLSNSYLEPPSFSKFIARMMVGRKSMMKKAKS
jgi:hypothetical protein